MWGDLEIVHTSGKILAMSLKWNYTWEKVWAKFQCPAFAWPPPPPPLIH